MKADTLKRIIADLLGVGRNRVKIRAQTPEEREAVENAASRQDAYDLYAQGIVTVEKPKGHKGREERKRQGPGSRKGSKYSRKPKKEIWMERIRALRKLLRQLIAEGKVEAKHRRKLYLLIKGGHFKGKRSFLAYLKENGYLKG